MTSELVLSKFILVLKAGMPDPGVIVSGKAVIVVTYPSVVNAGVNVVVYATAIVVVMNVVLVDVVRSPVPK